MLLGDYAQKIKISKLDMMYFSNRHTVALKTHNYIQTWNVNLLEL